MQQHPAGPPPGGPVLHRLGTGEDAGRNGSLMLMPRIQSPSGSGVVLMLLAPAGWCPDARPGGR
ncbi:hypothetical protein GCM10010350_72010 [Streptomyces galilaeus]|nr:hypothetical protein GCM10010350_72010 [Streptomyces galilaeus]